MHVIPCHFMWLPFLSWNMNHIFILTFYLNLEHLRLLILLLKLIACLHLILRVLIQLLFIQDLILNLLWWDELLVLHVKLHLLLLWVAEGVLQSTRFIICLLVVDLTISCHVLDDSRWQLLDIKVLALWLLFIISDSFNDQLNRITIFINSLNVFEVLFEILIRFFPHFNLVINLFMRCDHFTTRLLV